MSVREGRGQPIIFCAAFTNPWSLYLSAMVQLPYLTSTSPGHLATVFVRRIWASHIICTFIEWKCSLFTCAYFPSDGAFIPICVQSIAPITFGKPTIAENSALMFDWLISSKYGLWLLHATPTTLVSLYYCQELSDKHLMGDLLAWMTSTVLKICNV